MANELPARCVSCEGGLPALGRAECAALLSEIPGWTLDHPRLRRSFRPADFRAALDWIGKVAEVAEEEGHHPDIHLTRWNRVELELWTHAVGGLTTNDFVLARRIGELALRHGIPAPPPP